MNSSHRPLFRSNGHCKTLVGVQYSSISYTALTYLHAGEAEAPGFGLVLRFRLSPAMKTDHQEV
jgi:hypothetical protein